MYVNVHQYMCICVYVDLTGGHDGLYHIQAVHRIIRTNRWIIHVYMANESINTYMNKQMNMCKCTNMYIYIYMYVYVDLTEAHDGLCHIQAVHWIIHTNRWIIHKCMVNTGISPYMNKQMNMCKCTNIYIYIYIYICMCM